MGIPIIGEIWDGIRWIIDFFINKTPTPIKVMIFLLFLLLFGVIISFFLHLTGIHCNSNLDVVKTSVIDVSTNLRVLFLTKDGVLTGQTATICDAHPDMCGSENDCYYFARLQNGSGFYEECNVTSTDPNCQYLMKSGSCFDCTSKEICFNPVGAFLFFNGFCTWHDVCISDADYIDYSTVDYSISCSGKLDCSVPRGYVWNITDGLYHCVDDNICGLNATESSPIIDEYLNNAGGELLYSDSSEVKDYTKAISIKCDNRLNPNLTFFGIPIFSYKIWLVLIVIYVMFMFLSTIKRH